MKKIFLPLVSLAASCFAAEPALTIYNQNFAVVRESLPLQLKSGDNEVRFSQMTATAETDSVILRDPSGKVNLQILEQSYRNDPVSEGLMLSINEGKTIDFFVKEPNKPDYTIRGKILRSGYAGANVPSSSPLIEVDGKLQFSLPGLPIFPSLGDDTILNPSLIWKLRSNKSVDCTAELAYITGGLTWKADYSIVCKEKSDLVDLIGWITFANKSGKTFKDAKIKLLAGDVNKIVPPATRMAGAGAVAAAGLNADLDGPPVTEKAFADFHIYSVARPTTLRDQETKQVEFLHAQGATAKRIYVYDGSAVTFGQFPIFRGSNDYGVPTNKKVWALREFQNSEANKLGIPLPKGRLRFYQQAEDSQLEFIGENDIDHTPKDETVRVYTGNSFDLTGERRRTDYKVNTSNRWLEESFEIKLRNHSKDPVEIRVVEHLFRFDSWEITDKSTDYRKLDSHTIEFRATVKPDDEKIVTYRVHYSW